MQPKIHEQIEVLNRELLAMGARVEQNIGDAVRALIQRDADLARSVTGRDPAVDLAEIRIDRHCLDILALYQPVARDLRFVATAMKIVKDLERVGDMAKDIAHHALALLTQGSMHDSEELAGISRRAQQMLTRALDSFVRQDVALAREVIAEDDIVDEWFDQIVDRVKELIQADPTRVTSGIHLLAVAKYLERIGDHSSNVAEMVVFLVEGEDIRHYEKVKELRGEG